MTKEQKFYNRVEDEFDDFVQEIEEYDVSEFLSESERIAKMKSVYEYLTKYRPINEENYPQFMNFEKPIEAICNKYHYDQEEYQEELSRVIESLTNEYKMDKNSSFGELRWKIHKLWEEFQNLTVVYVNENDIEKVIDGIMNPGFKLNEYDSKIFLQFKNPLLVLANEIGRFDMPFDESVAIVIETLNNVDLLTGRYSLAKDLVLPETKQRHDAIVELMNIVPDFDFQTGMRWLDLNRAINECMLDSDGIDNPYQDFLKTMRDIKVEYGSELLQKVFDMGEEIVMQPAELVEVAKYLADGGDVDRVSELVDDDFFLTPYEEQKQGGMNLC